MSFSGGPTLRYIEEAYGAPKAVPLYCSVDPRHYEPRPQEARWDLGYLGTYSLDRQPPLQKMLVEPARQWREGSFVVAGPQYPEEIEWPENVHRIDHLPPAEHCDFYNQQRFTLNITRADMKKAGWSPSVRLFEAAACATPIISDWWEGLDEFFTPGVEIFISNGSEDTLEHLMQLPNDARREVGEAARRRVLANHTAGRRAQELEQHIHSALAERGRSVAAL
jgi:spore maturation protein CgeB